MPATGARNDPFRASTSASRSTICRSAAFSEVCGPQADGDAVDYREGTDRDNIVRKLVGLRK